MQKKAASNYKGTTCVETLTQGNIPTLPPPGPPHLPLITWPLIPNAEGEQESSCWMEAYGQIFFLLHSSTYWSTDLLTDSFHNYPLNICNFLGGWNVSCVCFSLCLFFLTTFYSSKGKKKKQSHLKIPKEGNNKNKTKLGQRNR